MIALSAIRIIWLLGKHFLLIKKLKLHLMAGFFLLVAVIASFSGYRHLSIFLFEGILGTLFVLLMFWLVIKITNEILMSIDEGKTAWSNSIRQKLGVKDEHPFVGLIWIKLSIVIIATTGLVLSLLAVWGISEQSYKQSIKNLLDGISIGDVTIEPLKVVLGILVMVALINLSNAIKRHLAQQWFNHMQLSRGANDAVVTITGYIGTIFAILIGLSIAGLELANLAIIVGALSVGIGFGLQNIVNNFVSGLILLFERPISRGDLIKVGDNLGHVKDISTRSTTIRTFDAADIIVPNSELISGQVTNLMRDDNYARITISIGVAYGSDTHKVMTLLEQIANEHPDVIKDKDNMKASVFFVNFGDNSLDFRLYCFVEDIGKRLRTQSDLNLSIDQAFRDANIDIPFPQRTVHLLNPPAPIDG
jgi:small-conductance mechanosensitive channel